MNSAFNVRLFHPRDLPGILELWEAHSGWGGITERQWNEWYMDTPWGESVVVIVEDHERQIVGQAVSTPFPVMLDSLHGTAYRLSAPILKEKVRTGRVTDPEHPTRRMLEMALTEVRTRGALAAYAMPLLSWRGFFRRIPGFYVQEYDCARVEVKPSPAFRDADLVVESAGSFKEEHRRFWQEAISQMPIKTAVERTEALWNYRLSQRLVLNVRTTCGKLLGYIAVKKKSGLVVDLLARNIQDLKRVVDAGVHALATRREEFGNDVSALKLMVTPQVQEMMTESGLDKEDFRFLFCVIPTSGGLEPPTLSPSNWYLTAGD